MHPDELASLASRLPHERARFLNLEFGIIAAAPQALETEIGPNAHLPEQVPSAFQFGGFSERLSQLKRVLHQRGLDGFIWPLSDEYCREFPPEPGRRVQWLTGFGGSAGLPGSRLRPHFAVCRDKVCLFVDGRYVTEAREAYADTEISIQLMSECRLSEWLRQLNLGKCVVGFNPWLLTVHEASELRASLAERDSTLQAEDNDPIDEVWTDKPRRPWCPLIWLDTARVGTAPSEKILRLVDFLKHKQVDMILISSIEEIAWLLNIRSLECAFLPAPDCFALCETNGVCHLFIEGSKTCSVTDSFKQANVRVHDIGAFHSFVSDQIANVRSVALDPISAPVGFARILSDKLIRIEQMTSPLRDWNAQKNEAELEQISRAHICDGIAVTRFLYLLDVDFEKLALTEYSAAELLEDIRAVSDIYRGPSFPWVSAADANAAKPHYRPDNHRSRKLGADSVYLTDSGGQYRTGTTDVTRTIVPNGGLGSPAFRSHYTMVLRALITLSSQLFPKDALLVQLDAIARSILWRHGLDYDHGTGHGVGCFLSVHERPFLLSPKAGDARAVSGMFISIEPALYFEGRYGIRLENLVSSRANDNGTLCHPRTLAGL